jgi:hypothetical protein
VSCGEILGNVRRGKLDENLLTPRPWSLSQALGLVSAVCSFAVVDIREEESWDDFRGEKESNVDAILEGESEEQVRLDLAR